MQIYTDGGVISKNPSSLGLTWAWVMVHRRVAVDRSSGVLLPGQEDTEQLLTSNQAEYYAVLMALESLGDGRSAVVYSDSQVTIRRLFGHYPLKNIPDSWARRMAVARGRLGALEGIEIRGHPTRAELAAGTGRVHQVACHDACVVEQKAYLAELARPLPAHSL